MFHVVCTLILQVVCGEYYGNQAIYSALKVLHSQWSGLHNNRHSGKH